MSFLRIRSEFVETQYYQYTLNIEVIRNRENQKMNKLWKMGRNPANRQTEHDLSDVL